MASEDLEKKVRSEWSLSSCKKSVVSVTYFIHFETRLPFPFPAALVQGKFSWMKHSSQVIAKLVEHKFKWASDHIIYHSLYILQQKYFKISVASCLKSVHIVVWLSDVETFDTALINIMEKHLPHKILPTEVLHSCRSPITDMRPRRAIYGCAETRGLPVLVTPASFYWHQHRLRFQKHMSNKSS